MKRDLVARSWLLRLGLWHIQVRQVQPAGDGVFEGPDPCANAPFSVHDDHQHIDQRIAHDDEIGSGRVVVQASLLKLAPVYLASNYLKSFLLS